MSVAYLEKLNSEQRRAVEKGIRETACVPSTPFLVIAVAGLGKDGHTRPPRRAFKRHQSRRGRPLCNLYSVTKGQQAIRELAGAMRDKTGNLPSMAGIFPDYSAPIVRNQPEGRELTKARWGMPSPAFALLGKNSDPGVTNVRNVKSPHWRRWLGIENRCIVPWTSFSEIIWTSGCVE